MKRIVTSIVILALLTGLCVWSVFTVHSKTDSLLDKIHAVEKAFEDKDSENCIKLADELQEEWKDFMDRSILINDLGHALDITSSIAEIRSFAEADNEELYASCDRAEVQIEIFKNLQLPTLWKIL